MARRCSSGASAGSPDLGRWQRCQANEAERPTRTGGRIPDLVCTYRRRAAISQAGRTPLCHRARTALRPLHAPRPEAYSGMSNPGSMTCERPWSSRVLVVALCGAAGPRRRPAQGGAGAGAVRDRRRPEGPLEGGDLPLGEGRRARSDLRRRLQQPGHRLRARGACSTRPARPTTRRSQLDPNNISIRQNYDFFKEINDRASRRTTR